VLWVLLFAAIALAGAAMVIGYAVWLAHKTSDVFSEVAVLGRQAAQLGELLGQISPDQHPRGPDATRDLKGAVDAR
jgi:hypothetical protein